MLTPLQELQHVLLGAMEDRLLQGIRALRSSRGALVLARPGEPLVRRVSPARTGLLDRRLRGSSLGCPLGLPLRHQVLELQAVQLIDACRVLVPQCTSPEELFCTVGMPAGRGQEHGGGAALVALRGVRLALQQLLQQLQTAVPSRPGNGSCGTSCQLQAVLLEPQELLGQLVPLAVHREVQGVARAGGLAQVVARVQGRALLRELLDILGPRLQHGPPEACLRLIRQEGPLETFMLGAGRRHSACGDVKGGSPLQN
mmetsp:Transcript_9623/g.28938  ORF Transcript_9623/g.28938 Transcript_9623/m.28938 type:complete len:257 (-) Transcript_9623:26-796(-)